MFIAESFADWLLRDSLDVDGLGSGLASDLESCLEVALGSGLEAGLESVLESDCVGRFCAVCAVGR